MTSRSCAVKIGSENMDSISRVLFNNCIITKSNRGIGIQNRDEGTVSDVTFSNITLDCHLFSDVWWGKAEPIYVTSYPAHAATTRMQAGVSRKVRQREMRQSDRHSLHQHPGSIRERHIHRM